MAEENTQFRVVDRRQFTNPERVSPQGPAEDRPRYPSYVEELMGRVKETEQRYEQKRQQVDDEIARLRARMEGDFNRRLELARRDLLLPFLDVLDNLERTLASAAGSLSAARLIEGVEMTANQFRSQLRAQGVTPLPVFDEPFDPNVSQAVGIVEVTDPAKDGVVVEEVQPGYRIGEQLLRPAQVRVGRAS